MRYLNKLLLLLALCSVQLFSVTPARAQLSFTQQELDIYRQRAGLVAGVAPGPFFSLGDTASKMGPYAPGDFQRIKQYADDFRASPYDIGVGNSESLDLWPGYIGGKIDSLDQYPIWQGVKLQASAFWYLLTNDTSYGNPVRRTLLRQIDIGGTTNLANWPTTTRRYPSDESAAKESNWHTRLLIAKNWIRPLLNQQENTKADSWFLDAANYYMARHVRKLVLFFPNRGSGDYTVRKWLAQPQGWPPYLPEDPIYLMASGANDWAGDRVVRRYVDASGKLGPKVSRLEEFYNNRVSEKMLYVGLTGIVINRPDLTEEAYRTATEMIRFATASDGSPGELERNGDYFNAAQGLWYHALNVQYMVVLADAMARRGDLRLYQFTTSDGAHSTVGGPKSLQVVVDYFAKACAGKNPHYYKNVADTNKIDNYLHKPNKFGLRYMAFDYLVAIANRYYRNPVWKRIYQHTEPGTVPIPSGGYSTAAMIWLPWAGTGAELVAGYGLHADMEDRANPYKLCGPGGPRIMDVVLVNAGTDRDVVALRNGQVVNLTTGPSTINFRASTCPDTVGSVEYILTRTTPVTTSSVITNSSPYAFQGFSNGDYVSWVPQTGFYRLQARVWSGPNKSGTSSTLKEVRFEVRQTVK